MKIFVLQHKYLVDNQKYFCKEKKNCSVHIFNMVTKCCAIVLKKILKFSQISPFFADKNVQKRVMNSQFFLIVTYVHIPRAALMPPCAATVCDLVGNSLVTTAVLNPSWTKPNAALSPAPPAPITRASCWWSTTVQALPWLTEASFNGDAPPTDKWRFLQTYVA